MNLLGLSRGIAIAILTLVTANLMSAEQLKARHKSHHHSSSDSCCKSVKKRLHSVNRKLNIIAEGEKRLIKLAPKPITQKMISKAGGTLVLHYSGDYCVTENITGTIVIEADSVCLDLGCHTLDAAGRPNAIVADGYQDLKIFDGRIINATDAAILIDNYSSVEIFKLVMNNNALDAIRQSNSTDLSVHDVDFINDNSGERALLFDTCDNISVNHCNASGFLSTIGAIVQLDSCDAASIQNVDVTNNTKTAGANVNEFSPGTAFVSVIASTGVDFVLVKVNNNTFNNNVPVTNQNVHWRTAEAIMFLESTSCSLHQCETNNNTDIAGALATADTEEYILLLLACDSFIVTEHQSNNNVCEQLIVYYSAMVAFDSSNIVFDGCQVNNTSVQLLSSITLPRYMPIWVTPYFGSPVTKDCELRNCQANFNVLQSAPAVPTVICLFLP